MTWTVPEFWASVYPSDDQILLPGGLHANAKRPFDRVASALGRGPWASGRPRAATLEAPLHPHRPLPYREHQRPDSRQHQHVIPGSRTDDQLLGPGRELIGV